MGNKGKQVTPRTLKGFQDLLPPAYIPRRSVVRTIEEVFETYGFTPLDSPAVEHLDVLLGPGGEEVNKELFRFETPEEEPVALRFDLTVPFARMMAQYPEQLKPPFRRYALGPVWRADKPAPGRFRQFTQVDIDAAGADTVAVDAEIIAVMSDIMTALRVPEHRVLINNRKVIDALLEHCGITDEGRQKHVLRVIDKRAKVGTENIRKELGEGRIDDSGDPIPGVHLDDNTIHQLLSFIAITGESRATVVEHLEGALPDSGPAQEATAEMRELAEALDALGVDEAHAVFDPSLARGLDYYTGPVFEMTIPCAPQFGSVMGGGRYNALVARFLNRPVAATGMSVGLDRLMAALEHMGVAPAARTPVEVLVVSIGKVAKADTLKIAAELRSAGLRTETFFAARKKMQLGNQLSHADHYGIPVAVIVGEEELERGEVAIKDLLAGKAERAGIEDRDEYRAAGKTGQKTVPRSGMISAVRELL